MTNGNIEARLRRTPALLWALLATLVACAPAHLPAPEQAQRIVGHQSQGAKAQGPAMWRIDPQQSLIAVTVRRAGTLARLGHDHVVASGDVNGCALQQKLASAMVREAHLQFRLDQLSVDEPALRKRAGFDTQPGQEAIDGTRRNMLVKILDAERFPLVSIAAYQRAGGAQADAGQVLLALAITLHGVTRMVDASAAIEGNADTITVIGNLQLKQSDFGITPFSVLGGAIAVADRLDLEYRIVAERQEIPCTWPRPRHLNGQ